MNVAFFIYRRPALTAQVFARIAAAQPEQLFIVGDGPRSPEETAPCSAARAVAQQVGWPCKVHTKFAAANLGCKRSLSEGLAWVFSKVDDVIVLEDDCLPHPSFFPFCQTLLDRYRNDSRVFDISGELPVDVALASPQSYFFSKYGSIWGWASWRRSWELYDPGIPAWPAVRDEGWPAREFEDVRLRQLLCHMWDKIHAGEIDTWDLQWGFARLYNGLVSIVPAVNLVSNIGFGTDGVHTMDPQDSMANRPVRPMRFPLVHPESMLPDATYEEAYIGMILAHANRNGRPLANRGMSILKRLLRRVGVGSHLGRKGREHNASDQ